ncbi:unnamed protein product [Cuscuta europaea]|uniref:Reverse transcriptase Ty1/copia-type domain-containing protein n=1 Tax=Cuscuta europaea TaxID=41803 RepID=A0A9P1ELM6_CUSEU|nr:unnamed protein product [Cuscuta europaea]
MFGLRFVHRVISSTDSFLLIRPDFICPPIVQCLLLFKVALQDSRWKKAMDEEYQALLRNHTWDLVPPAHHSPITCRWIFRVKRHSDGSIARFKARLVARGFLQQPGRDYSETFSPVFKPSTLRIVLTIALSRAWPIRQLDVNNAFLHGTLEEEVYMVQPPGFEDPAHPTHLCRLKKALYGLKQAPRAWYLALSRFLLSMGFRRSQTDHSLFVYNHAGVLIYFLVYVDDIVLTGSSDTVLARFISQLTKEFSVKDLGPLHHFLGIEVVPHPTGLLLSQRQYILTILKNHGMLGIKPAVTPMRAGNPGSSTSAAAFSDITGYRRALGMLQYLSFTRPDISFAVNRLSQYMHCPSVDHWTSVKRIFRYLKGTLDFGLYLHKSQGLQLTAFSDSDWGGTTDDGRSTTAYVLYLGPNIISWKSTKQKSVSRSSTEAEYRAVANAGAEILWVKNVLHELGITLSSVPMLYCDNQGATYVCVNPVFHSRMKHLALDFFFVRELIKRGQLHVSHISTKLQIADALTKPLGQSLFEHFRSKLGVSDGTSILRGRITT